MQVDTTCTVLVSHHSATALPDVLKTKSLNLIQKKKHHFKSNFILKQKN